MALPSMVFNSVVIRLEGSGAAATGPPLPGALVFGALSLVFVVSALRLQLETPKAAMSASAISVNAMRAGVQNLCVRAGDCFGEVIRSNLPFLKSSDPRAERRARRETY